MYGPNSAEVAAYLDILPTLTAEQWGARAVYWHPTAMALRESVLEYAKYLAVNLGRADE